MELGEIGAISGHSHEQVGVLLRAFLGRTQGARIDHIELRVPAADIAQAPDERCHLPQAFRTGGFDQIYVLVPNNEGQFQVAIGAAYAFYEFWVPRGERMTDEEWREVLAQGNAPARPAWLSILYD